MVKGIENKSPFL